MTEDLKSMLISKSDYLVLTGSRGYQCHNEDSDYDYQGFYMPPVNQVTQPLIRGYGETPRHIDTESRKEGALDYTLHSVVRFMERLRLGTPNVVELLYLPVVKIGTFGNFVRSNRRLWVNQRTIDKFVSVAHAMKPDNYHHWRLRLSAYDLSTKGYIDYDAMGPKLRLLREENWLPECPEPEVLGEPDESAMLELLRDIIVTGYNIPRERL